MQKQVLRCAGRVSEIEQLSKPGKPVPTLLHRRETRDRAVRKAVVLAIGATAVEPCLRDRSSAASRLAEGGAFVGGARPNIALNADAFRRPLRGRKPAGQFRR